MSVLIDYTEHGVRFVGNVGTTQHIYRLDPETREIEAVVTTPNAIDTPVSATPDGGALAYVGYDGATVNEIYRVCSSRSPAREADRHYRRLDDGLAGIRN